MDNVNEAIKSIENLWKQIYEACVDNPALYKPHLTTASLDEVGECVLTVLAWLKRLGTKKRAAGMYRLSHGLLIMSLEQTVGTLKQIASGQYNHFPTLLTRLNQAFVSLFPLAILSTDKGEDAFAVLSAQSAEQYSELKKATETLNKEIESLEASEEVLANAQQAAARADEASKSAETQRDKALALLKEMNETSDSVATLAEEAETNEKTIKTLAARVEKLTAFMNEQTERHDKLIAQAEKDQKRITDLLPEATSAGLASAFADRAEKVSKPQKWWLVGFGVSLVLLCITIILAFVVISSHDEDFLFAFIRRVAFAAPWVWAAWFCARNYGHLSRLQEVYAYKQTISQAFEGYKTQMLDIGKNGVEDKQNLMVQELSARVMEILSKDPLMVFDRKSADDTPFHSLIERFVSGREKPEKKGE